MMILRCRMELMEETLKMISFLILAAGTGLDSVSWDTLGTIVLIIATILGGFWGLFKIVRSQDSKVVNLSFSGLFF